MTNQALPNLSSLEFWRRPLAAREADFKLLRDTQPISWQPQPEGALLPPSEGSGGYWAVVRYEDIRTVSRDPAPVHQRQGRDARGRPAGDPRRRAVLPGDGR